MKITAELALSQIKIKRTRTLWTIIGICLSTALVTAVCSFVASGNALVADLYGNNNNGNILFFALLVPAAFLCLIIVAMSVIVVSNSFRVSASERTMQFGILKSVGATTRQISSTVMYESFFLSLIGIPTGIILGQLLTFIGVNIANAFLSEINDLVHIMMNELIIIIEYKLSWQALFAATLISFFSTLISAWLPAHKSSKRAAIDSIRCMGEVDKNRKTYRTNRLVKKLFGFEGVLAMKNLKRNNRNFRASVISLVIGIVLFVNLGSLSHQVNAIEKLLYPDISASVMVDYTSKLIDTVNEKTSKNESIIARPISSDFANIVTMKLQEYDKTDLFCIGYDMETYRISLPKELITSEMMEVLSDKHEFPNQEMAVELITVDNVHYEEFCKQADVPIGSNILINRYDYNDKGNAVVFSPFHVVGESVQLYKADDSITDIYIHGQLSPDEIPNELMGVNTRPFRIIIPAGEMRGFSWYADTSDISGFMAYATDVMAEFFPREKEIDYMELGFTTRVYRFDDYMKIMNIAIVLVSVFIYCFVALLMLIGLTSVISTMSTNIQARHREFSVLQSVGLTFDGLVRMINLESLLCSIKALGYGLPLAITLTYFINLPIRATFPVRYHFPLVEIVIAALVVFLIARITMYAAVVQFKKKNIIETIRLDR